MLELRISGVRVRLYFGFFAALMAYLYAGRYGAQGIGAALCCCFLHELGHLTAMFALGCPPHIVSLYAGGISINTGRIGLMSRGAQTLILSTGCAVNFLLALASRIAGIRGLAEVNLALGIFNLLPYPYFDGGRILRLYLPARAADLLSVLISAAAMAAMIFYVRADMYAILIFIFAAAAGRLLERP